MQSTSKVINSAQPQKRKRQDELSLAEPVKKAKTSDNSSIQVPQEIFQKLADQAAEIRELKSKNEFLIAGNSRLQAECDNLKVADKKPKRKNTTVSKEKRDKLFAHFHKFRKPTTKQLRKIAEELELPEKYVSDWFQNRRNEKVGREEIKPTCKCTPEQTKRRFTEAERDEMRALYNEDSHPNQEQMQEVANKICLPKSKIAAWFCQERNARGETNKRPASLKINRKSN